MDLQILLEDGPEIYKKWNNSLALSYIALLQLNVSGDGPNREGIESIRF